MLQYYAVKEIDEMKTMLFCFGLLSAALLMATDFIPDPIEETPFQIVIEDVAETENVTPVQPATPAATPAVAAPVAATHSQPSLTAKEADQVDEIPEADVEPNCAHILRPPKAYDKEVLMLQIFLDRFNFSCGVIDGVWGEGSLKAMRAWQKSHGAKQTAWVDVPLYAEIATMPEALIRYAITAEDMALVTGPMPSTINERAKMELLGYDTIGACIAERFHTSERTLRRLNPAIINWPEDLQEGSILVVPNVRTPALEKPARLVVALKECVLAGYNAEGTMVLRFPCSIARNRAHLPEAGTLKVINMAEAPNYTYDPANYGQDPSVGKKILAAGPRNPVGSRWIGLSLSGYGIHGTPQPNTVGRPESRGCFRLTNWNAEKLFELISVGMPVEVVDSLSEIKTETAQVAPVAEEPNQTLDVAAETTVAATAEAPVKEQTPAEELSALIGFPIVPADAELTPADTNL